MRRLFTLFILLSLCLFSCARGEQIPPRAILDRILSASPAGCGIIRDSSLPEGDPERLDPLLFRALYARADGSDDLEDVSAAALFLGSSASVHREIAVFACRGRESAREVASLCRDRAELIRQTLGSDPMVLVYRSTVVLLALPDPAPTVALLDRLLG